MAEKGCRGGIGVNFEQSQKPPAGGRVVKHARVAGEGSVNGRVGAQDYGREAEEFVHGGGTSDQGTRWAVHGDGEVDGFDDESVAYGEALVGRFEAELIAARSEALIDMRQGVEAGEVGPGAADGGRL